MANRLNEDEKNERIIRNLLKLPENRRCINCNSLGPQYVCTNFSTFVCTNCSGIHREFTHRVKSVSMAKFTPQEVSALQRGGNVSAREIYLKEWDAQRNSSPDGSNVERLRTFIKHVYVDRKFTGEKNLEKPLRAKMGETDDFNTNRTDSYQASSRSPPYGDRGDRLGPGARSPGYSQEVQRNSSDNKRSPAHSEVVVNDWRREDRFGNGRMSDDRSSDAGSKPGGRSPDSQRSDMSSPPMVRPVRDILGDNVSPLRVIEPPKAKTIDPPPQAQRSASSSSLASSTDGNPPEVKKEVSFIDFDDTIPEPQTVPQEKTSSDPSAVQMAVPSGDNWANFDFAPQAKANTVASNSLESSLLDLSVPSPASGSSSSIEISSFQSNASPFGVVAPTHSSIGAPAQLTNTSGNLPENFPTGGQWPNMMPQPVTPAIPGFSSMLQNPSPTQYTHGPPGVSVVQTPAKPAMNTAVGFSAELLQDTTSGGRKELPADLFAMNYSYVPPSAPGWYSGSPYGAAVHMQYNMSMGLPNMQPVPSMQPQPLPSMEPVPRSTNPFDFSSEPSSDQPSTFPSLTSLHGAIPNTQPPSAIPSYASPSPYAGPQQTGGNIAPRPQTQSGFGLEENAFTSLYTNHQLGGLHAAHSATSNFTPTSGNPFG